MRIDWSKDIRPQHHTHYLTHSNIRTTTHIQHTYLVVEGKQQCVSAVVGQCIHQVQG